jgi:hypothetical protein
MYNIPKCLLDNLFKVVNGGSMEELTSSFLWSSTDQGFRYWQSRALGIERLSPSDNLYLLLCYHVSEVIHHTQPIRVELTPSAMSLLEFHTSPETYALYEASSASPELDRVLENIRRHRSAGHYDRAKALHSIGRYVVEPAAIQVNTPGRKWWETYPAERRQAVADMVLRGWERELGI